MTAIKAMRLIIFLTLLAVLSCKNNDKRVDKGNAPDMTVSAPKPNSELSKTDSKYPKWLTKLYPKEIRVGNRAINQSIYNLEVLNDSVLYITYERSDGVCGLGYLITFLNQQKKDSLCISDICDHELSDTTYSWKEGGIINQTGLFVMNYTETVVDSLIDENGKIKDDLDFFEAETTIDSTLTKYEVTQSGAIRRIKSIDENRESKELFGSHKNHLGVKFRIVDMNVSFMDSILVKELLKGLKNPLKSDIYAYSKQNSPEEFKLYTIVIPEETCWTSMSLISVSEKDSVIDQIKIAGFGGCDLPSEMYADVINDSIIKVTDYPDLGHWILDSLPPEGVEVQKIIKTYKITNTGFFNLTHKDTIIEIEIDQG